MKITIDTKQDSHEDMAKIIRLLQNIIGEKIELSDIPLQQESSSAFTNLFADNSEISAPEPIPKEPEPLDEEEPEDNPDVPEVTLY